MNLFKQTIWKWWELKIIAWGALFLGISIGTTFATTLANWTGIFFIGFIVLWIYILLAWYKK